jgi:hypothetical protein
MIALDRGGIIYIKYMSRVVHARKLPTSHLAARKELAYYAWLDGRCLTVVFFESLCTARGRPWPVGADQWVRSDHPYPNAPVNARGESETGSKMVLSQVLRNCIAKFRSSLVGVAVKGVEWGYAHPLSLTPPLHINEASGPIKHR